MLWWNNRTDEKESKLRNGFCFLLGESQPVEEVNYLRKYSRQNPNIIVTVGTRTIVIKLHFGGPWTIHSRLNRYNRITNKGMLKHKEDSKDDKEDDGLTSSIIQ